jgi:signal transduction histidine kinase
MTARLVAGVLVVCLFVVAVVAISLYRSRLLYRDQALTATHNLVQLIERDFTAVLDKADLGIVLIKGEIESDLARGRMDAKRLKARVAVQVALHPELDGIYVAGTNGTVVISEPAPVVLPLTVGDRDYFIRLRDDPLAGLVISAPIVGRNSGKWIITAARRLNRPDGRFAGVVYASIFLERFEKTLAALQLGSSGAATLRNENLQLLARHTRQVTSPTPVGNSTVSEELQQAIKAGPGGGTYIAATSLDGIERVNSYRRMQKYPFYILVGLATNDYLAAWRAEALTVAALLATLIVAAALFTLTVAVAWCRHDADAQRIIDLQRASLRKSEEHLQLALGSAEMGVWSLDLKSGDFSADAQARVLYGLPADEPLGEERVLATIVAEDRDAARNLRAEALRGGKPCDIEIRVAGSDEAPRWLHMRGTREASGPQTERLIGVVQDITGRKRMEADIRALNASLEQKVAERTAHLEQAIKDLESFSYSTSHDLRNPLRGINGWAQILLVRESAKLSEEGQRMLSRIAFNATRLGLLIDKILDYSRIGRASAEREVVDLDEVCGAVVDELRAAYPTVEIRAGLLAKVWGDRTMLVQVLQNLIGNACKFSANAASPLVEIGCVARGEELVFHVRDNGAGFDMAYEKKMFRMFERLHTEEQFPGTGVGLAIVKRLLDHLGGSIRAESAPGKGATFYFQLEPAAQAADLPSESRDAA